MVALFCLFNALNISGELLFIDPCGAINALQLFVIGITTPVSAAQFGKFKYFQKPCIRHVWATTHIDVFLVKIQTHGLLIGHIVDQA